MTEFLLSRLSPFQHKEFRRFYFVQTLSTIGKWSHDLARAWIVVEMFGKAGALGTLLLAAAVPSLLFILFGGVLVDRLDVKKIFIGTSLFLCLASFALASLTEFSNIQFWHLLIFGVIEGLIMAFKSPAFQALTVRLVPKQDFQQALALNSINFHLGRTLGPLIAGLLMAWKGPSAVFLFDGITYFILILTLAGITLRQATLENIKKESPWDSLKHGLGYVWETDFIRYKMLQLLGAISLIFPIMIVVFRTYITEKFGLDEGEFGYVFMWPALGSALGSVSFTLFKPSKPLRALIPGVPMTTTSLVLITLADSLWLTCGLMMVCGFSVYLSFVSLTISLHLDVIEEYRGRMSSLIGMGFLSIGPLMSFPVGYFADVAGFETSVYFAAGGYLILSAILATLHWKRWEARGLPNPAI